MHTRGLRAGTASRPFLEPKEGAASFGRLGHFVGLLKLHKGQQTNGLYKIRIVVSHHKSVLTHISRACGRIYRRLRYKMEEWSRLHVPALVTCIPDVTDLVVALQRMNARILNKPNMNMQKLKICTVDMKDMYPATSTTKSRANIKWGARWCRFNEKELDFVLKAGEYINKFSYFEIGDRVYLQPQGAIIGSH